MEIIFEHYFISNSYFMKHVEL